jgi:sRNA-binding carbon storage regulator CsrA
MLVLRRRSQEVIVFEGGLTLTVVELVDHHAWLSFEGPGIDGAITFSPMATNETTATIGIRSPSSITFDGSTGKVTRSSTTDPASDRAVILLRIDVGERIDFDGLGLELSSLANGRATLTVDVACLPSRVGVAVHAVSGAEARIGIDAPPEIRVTRKELWLEMLAANQGASTTTASLDALRRDSDATS